MKVKLEVDCTPLEARAFLGLPDVKPLNDQLIREMKTRMASTTALGGPEELMKSWATLGGQATEQFRKLMTVAVATAKPPKTPE